jgi:WD40 repeat protein
MKRETLASTLIVVLAIFIITIVSRNVHSWYRAAAQSSKEHAQLAAKEKPTHPSVSPILTLTGFKGVIGGVSFSSDNTKLATADSGGNVTLWNLQNKKPLLTYEKSKDTGSVIFSANGDYLISPWIEVWNGKTGKLLRKFEGGHRGDAIIEALMYNPYTQKDYVQKSKVPAGLTDFKISTDGRYFATSSNDRTTEIWDTKQGKLKWVLKGHTGSVESIAFSSDGKLLASGSADRTVKIWDVGTGKLKKTLKGSTDTPRALTFISGNKLLASANQDGAILIWDVSTGKLNRKHDLDSIIPYAVFSGDGRRLLTQMTDYGLADNQIAGGIEIYDTMSGQMLYDLNVDNFGIQAYTLSNDGKMAAVGGAEYNQKHKNGYQMAVEVWNIP